MLIINLHTLEAIYVLNFLNEIVRQVLDTTQTQYIVWIRLAIGDDFASCDLLALKHVEVTPLRNQLFIAIGLTSDDEATLTLGFFTEANRTSVLSHNRRLFRLACLKQISDSWQTARDVASLRRLLWYTSNNVPNRYLRAISQRNNSADRQSVNSWDLCISKADFNAIIINQLGDRT